MKPCQHGWPLRGGMECPECLWQEATVTSPPYTWAERQALVRQAVARAGTDRSDNVPLSEPASWTAAACLPTREGKLAILTIAREQNNYSAIREAKRRLI